MGFFKDKWNNFLINLFLGKRKEGILKELDQASKDPELQQAFSDLGYATDHMELLTADFCRRHPDDKNCQDYKIGDYEKVLKRLCKKYPDDKELLKRLQEMRRSEELK
tara:strand:- start:1068 stop:1391 length:324 start_codon:yes stop_codon:yes gene_type:complete